MEQPELDERDFKDLREHLGKPNIPMNKGKKNEGKSRCFGMVRKRSQAPDLSKDSWTDPRLHYLLMRFGREHVNIPFTSIQVSDNETHVKHSQGNCYIVSFGDYTDGEIVIDTKEYNIRHRPLVFDISKLEHTYSSKEFRGVRYTLIYYTLLPQTKFPMVKSLSEYEAGTRDGEYVIAWYKDGEPTQYLSKKNGLPQPVRKKKEKKEEKKKPPKMTSAVALLYEALSAQSHRMDN